MKILQGNFTNFGSYKEFNFNFSNVGLALVYGKTGSGKSTIPDMIAWTLFGVTAKDGSADDVLSWISPGEVTKGTLEVELNGSTIMVTRHRGRSSQNDLFWTEKNGPEDHIRGKDLCDTQKLLESRLCVTKDLFITGAYFHEFSPTGSFFNANAKQRRDIFETIADTTLAVHLGERCSSNRKLYKKRLSDLSLNLSLTTGKCRQLCQNLASAGDDSLLWRGETEKAVQRLQVQFENFEKEKGSKIAALQTKSDKWQADKNSKIDALCDKLSNMEGDIKDNKVIEERMKNLAYAEVCPKCHNPDKSYYAKITKLKEDLAKNNQLIQKFEDGRLYLLELQGTEDPFITQIHEAMNLTNQYGAQLEAKKLEVNPFILQSERMAKEKLKLEEEVGQLTKDTATAEHRLACLNKLYDLSSQLRGEMLTQAVANIQDSTNSYLERYFDSEIRVDFALDGADDLKVDIQKSGHQCSYKQLSKGQRQLLKLCFVVSVMKAASNKAGIHFSNLFFDEALDGLDSDLKVKAFGLLEELSTEHESVLVIDHAPEFQQLFTKRFEVTMEADISNIQEID